MSLRLEGLGLEEASELVRAKAVEMAAGGARGVWTEVGRNNVMVGLCIDGASAVLLIDRAEYDGMRLLGIVEGACQK